jgi:hypothetical protein
MKPLDYDQLRIIVPAAFAEHEADHLSERYTFVNSFNIVQEFEKQGYFPVSATQSFNTIDADVGKHMIRFRHAEQLDSTNKNGISELVMTNSHNGKSRLALYSGIFRQVCSNGLIAFVDNGGYSEKHDMLTLNSVNKGLEDTITLSLETVKRSEAMQAVALTNDSALYVAELMKLTVYQDRDIDSSLLLKPRRSYDTAKDLWTIFNVVQENILKGGVACKSESGLKGKTRPITQIDRNVAINQKLWEVADEMLEEFA